MLTHVVVLLVLILVKMILHCEDGKILLHRNLQERLDKIQVPV